MNTPVYNWGVTSYAANGNVKGMTDAVMGTWSYSYDDLNRLTSGTATAGPACGAELTWGIDPFGNRTSQTATSTGQDCTPQITVTQTQLTMNGKNQVEGWGYDADGDVTNDTRNSYTYDAENRLATMDSDTYVYDAEGRRVAKESGGTVTNVYLLGLNGEQVTEVNAGGWAHSNLFANGKLLATYDGPAGTEAQGYYFHFTDWLGTERVQTYADGELNVQCISLPFGDGPNCQHATEQQFTGKERDAESGNDYFGARYYASSMGRFTSPDYADEDEGPVSIPDYNPSNPQSLNLYSYVRNNPITDTDPDGHDCVVQSRTSDTTENVTVSSGNCDNVSVGDGQTKTYVAGTVDVGSIQGNGSGGISFNYTTYGGDAGVASFNGAPVPDNPGLAYNWGNNAQGYQMLAGAANVVNKGTAIGIGIYGAAFVGAGGLADMLAGGGSTSLGDLSSDLTVHAQEAEMLARHGITPEQARAAIEAAKKSGDVVEAMGRYGPQLRYTANGIRVIVATTGRNAGKIITAFFK